MSSRAPRRRDRVVLIGDSRGSGAVLAREADDRGMETSTIWKPVTGLAARVALGVVLALALLVATAVTWAIARARGA
jgi:hypothetical protein